MIVNAVTNLLTFNLKDFARYNTINALDPNAIASGAIVR